MISLNIRPIRNSPVKHTIASEAKRCSPVKDCKIVKVIKMPNPVFEKITYSKNSWTEKIIKIADNIKDKKVDEVKENKKVDSPQVLM